jgi:hypothetical protein
VLTRRMTAAFRAAEPMPPWRGYHWCICGARSSDCDYRLPNGELTNLLCVHYLAFHRGEVPDIQLRRVEDLTYGEAEPTRTLLYGEGAYDPERFPRLVRPLAWLVYQVGMYPGQPAVSPVGTALVLGVIALIVYARAC